MAFGTFNFEGMLGGSHVSFISRPHPKQSDAESKYQTNKQLQQGIQILRKLRTYALKQEDSQTALQEAHQLSAQMAQEIIQQASNPRPTNSAYLDNLEQLTKKYADQEADSGHALPSQFSVGHLFKAAEDMLARIELEANSIDNPTHKLNSDEMTRVLREYLRGANDLTLNAIEKLFDKDTRIGGILSGGSVYTEMAREITNLYADSSLRIDSFVIAVDKDKKTAVFEQSSPDTKTVIIGDDIIDTGATIFPALFTAGKYFPNAIIYSGKGNDQPGDFEKRRIQPHKEHLEQIYQDYADCADDGNKDGALEIFDQAEAYAKEHGVKLQRGWYSRKERLEKL